MNGLLDAGLINNCIYRTQLLITKIIVAIFITWYDVKYTYWQRSGSVISSQLKTRNSSLFDSIRGKIQNSKLQKEISIEPERKKEREKRWRFENFSSTVRARSSRTVLPERLNRYYSQYRARESLPLFLLIRWKISYSRDSNNNLSTSSYRCCRLAAQILSSAENIDCLFREHGRVPEDGSETSSRNFVSLVSSADVNKEKKKKNVSDISEFYHRRISILSYFIDMK